MRKTLTLLTALAALTACGSSNEEPAAVPSSSAESAESAPAMSHDRDVTADLKASASSAAWAAVVTAATQTEAERVEVETSITDPRGDAGSSEAQQAIDVCNGAVAWLQSTGAAQPKVSVMESDGTTFVVYGHPSYPGGCTEV